QRGGITIRPPTRAAARPPPPALGRTGRDLLAGGRGAPRHRGLPGRYQPLRLRPPGRQPAAAPGAPPDTAPRARPPPPGPRPPRSRSAAPYSPLSPPARLPLPPPRTPPPRGPPPGRG